MQYAFLTSRKLEKELKEVVEAMPSAGFPEDLKRVNTAQFPQNTTGMELSVETKTVIEGEMNEV